MVKCYAGKAIAYALSGGWHFWLAGVVILLEGNKYYLFLININGIWSGLLIFGYLVILFKVVKVIHFLYKKRWLLHKPTLSYKDHANKLQERIIHFGTIVVFILLFTTVAYLCSHKTGLLDTLGLDEWIYTFIQRIYNRHQFILTYYKQVLLPSLFQWCIRSPLEGLTLEVGDKILDWCNIWLAVIIRAMITDSPGSVRLLLTNYFGLGISYYFSLLYHVLGSSCIYSQLMGGLNNLFSTNLLSVSYLQSLLLCLSHVEDDILWFLYFGSTLLLAVVSMIILMVFSYYYLLSRGSVESFVLRDMYPSPCGFYNQMRYHRRYKRKLANLVG